MANVMTVPAGSVKVRMYKQGFGDGFLIAFPGGDGKPVYALIDCGVHHKDKDNLAKMNRTANSVKEATDGRLDLVVVTHEHTDHIDGFKLAKEVFDGMAMENVWMGWTEDYANPRVKALDQAFAVHLEALKIVRDKLKASQSGLWETVDNLLAFYGEELGASGRMSNRQTMTWIQGKGGTGLKFCEPGEVLTLGRAENVRFLVLGPPLADSLLKKSAPSKGKKKETYITDAENAHLEDFALEVIRQRGVMSGALAAADAEASLQARRPFEDRYRVSLEQAKGDLDHAFDGYLARKNSWRQIDDKWLELAGELALKLDEHTNNTSLALAIEIGRDQKILLFPGDAQVGNWLGWQELKWKDGRKETTIDDLLEKTVLYKVGHHGSHNATLKSLGLEKMTHPELAALIPVDEAFAKNVAKWTSIPYPDLLARLTEKTRHRLIRSDKPAPGQKDRPYSLGKEEWKSFMKRVNETDLYTELTIAM